LPSYATQLIIHKQALEDPVDYLFPPRMIVSDTNFGGSKLKLPLKLWSLKNQIIPEACLQHAGSELVDTQACETNAGAMWIRALHLHLQPVVQDAELPYCIATMGEKNDILELEGTTDNLSLLCKSHDEI